ncbi:wax ester/triacylglycerol synthase family O-acyltransferase [Mycolicibacterium sp. P9-64]|uniref:wax ester/triacylglycerol synthase family O-acyltransferase n=1 Tax=Mycolicibacterium sp. P9-64 TaxID=2024612 RepID=UPI0011EF3EC2|nr:wax ester/triacylglycerol synthase family O-acyltransferase [Mycolicibacterium sp. P9-64]KAA0086656.1 wax ester/triacylglycerol synthase family O-acyltransferase [Mycolicibacterium sp. P9-64]
MDPMEPLDAAMMTAELLSDPLHAAALLILSPPPEAGPGYVDELYQHALTDTAELDPRFRRHPHAGIDTAGLWVWRTDEGVEMREHLQRRTLPAGAGREALWQLISELHTEPLDRSRPMWMAYVIDGLPGGRFAFYIKVHHTVIDGVAGLKMITDALSTDPQDRSMPPIYAAPPHRPAAHPGAARGAIPNPLALMRAALGGVGSGLGLIRQVALGEASMVLASLAGTAVLPLGAPYTRFNGRLGRERTVAGATWPKARIRAIEKAAGVTGNDVLTTVVAGVLREWLAAHGELPDRSLVAICPVTVRSREHVSDEDRHGNLFGLQLCPLGTDMADPAERLAYVHRVMSRAKDQVASRGSNATMLMLALSIAPTVLLPALPFAPRLRRGYNVSLSNVPGPQAEMYWNGAHLEEIYPVSIAIDGQALNATMCSYADRVTFGYVSGRKVMPDIGSLIPLTERAIVELETAVAGRRDFATN